MPMEGSAEGPAAEEYGARLSGPVELGRHVGAHPSCALRSGARAGGTRSKSDGCDHRLADREGRSKRGSWLDPSGYDAGKKIKGRKRHILVDTLGLLLNVVVHPADIQDRDGAFHLLRRARRLFPFIERIFADGGYARRKIMDEALSGISEEAEIEIVKWLIADELRDATIFYVSHRPAIRVISKADLFVRRTLGT